MRLNVIRQWHKGALVTICSLIIVNIANCFEIFEVAHWFSTVWYVLKTLSKKKMNSSCTNIGDCVFGFFETQNC
jgi:hypothetical protein